MVVVVGRWGLSSLEAEAAVDVSQRASAHFVLSSITLYLVIAMGAVVIGLLIATIAYAVGREADPVGDRFPLGYMMVAAAITAVVIGYGIARLGLEIAGASSEGQITVAATSLVLIIVIAGAIGGGATASVVDALARPAFIGYSGEAAPSMAVVMKEMLAAIGAPTVAVIVAAAFAVGLSQLLLTLHGAASTVAFSLVAAAILGLVTLLAYRPWERAT